MAGFLRKKSKQEPPAPPRPSVTANTPSSPATPLFARFATTASQNEPQRAVVSGPMTLASSARRDVNPVAQHRSHSTRAISNGMPINGQVRRDTIDQKAKDLPPLQSRPSYPQAQAQPRARPISRVSIDKPLPPPQVEPLPAPKPILSSTLLPPPVEARPASATDFALSGEYAHLWSVIAGEDSTILQGSPPTSQPPPPRSTGDKNLPEELMQPPPPPPHDTNTSSKPTVPVTARPPERPANGFTTSHTPTPPVNNGRSTLENLNDPSRHDLLTDTNYGRRLNPDQDDGNGTNMRTSKPTEDVFGSGQVAPPPPVKPNGSMPKSRPTSTYMQQTPERMQKELSQNPLPSPSSSPDSHRKLPRIQEASVFNDQVTPTAQNETHLPGPSAPDIARLQNNPAMGASSSSLGSHSIRSSVYKDIRTDDLSPPPPTQQQRNVIQQQPSPPVSPPQPQPQSRRTSVRQSLAGPPSAPPSLAGRGKPLIFAAMASVDPEPVHEFAPPHATQPNRGPDRPRSMAPPVDQVQQQQPFNNVPPQHQPRHHQHQQPPPPHFQNPHQFQQSPAPPQSYRPPPQNGDGPYPGRATSLNQHVRGPPQQPLDGPYPLRQNSVNQPGRGLPPQPQQQPPPPGAFQQPPQGPPRNNSIRWNDRGPPPPQQGPIHTPQPIHAPQLPIHHQNPNNLPPSHRQSFQQPQQPVPQPPRGPRASNSPPRDAAAQLRMSPEPSRASPTKGRRLSKKPPPSDVASIRSSKSQKRPGSGPDRPQSMSPPQQPHPQNQFQQRPPQHHYQEQQAQRYPPPGPMDMGMARQQPPPPAVSVIPGPPPHLASNMGPPPPNKMMVDRDPLGVPLNDDPFAKSDGVTMLSPFSKDQRGDFLGSELGEDGAFHSASESPSPRISQNLGPSDGLDRQENGELIEGEPGEGLPSIEEIPNDGKDRLTDFLTNPPLLTNLLSYFSFYDWCMILSISREIRFRVVQNPGTREAVLERFLKTVGYRTWTFGDPEPLSLSLQDLNDYMRGVSTPTHEYARVAALYIHSSGVHPSHRDQSLDETVANLSAATRSYTRVVLRLRAQAEKESSIARKNGRGGGSRPGSRAPSPTMSALSHSQNGHRDPASPQRPPIVSRGSSGFQSPLFRLRRAPLLRVFVPSPDGDWLSDKSVLECEAELRRAGVSHLMRMGDVVWDVAVGDEGNVGRLVWDGSYLIDLDYTYVAAGDLPKYLPTLAFPPSYFHRVIRSGPGSSNPIAHINIEPWGEEIAANLQLLQDRVRTETPQGAFHNVVRWVHRSSFQIRPIPRGGRVPNSYNIRGSPFQGTTRIPIPGSKDLFVDPGWYGTIALETEGTNEALADLQDRCGPGAFPPRPRQQHGGKGLPVEQDRKMVYRIMREKSRPGEIWIRTVSAKERLL